MQTLLAFVLEAPSTREAIEDRLRRVESWYLPLRRDSRFARCDSNQGGLFLWDVEQRDCGWPSWVQQDGRAVASLHVALGYERLVPDEKPVTRAPQQLVERLRAVPEDIRSLTPPFVLASFDRDSSELRLCTDVLGLGHLYELRTAEGRFWSNRPVAALRFAGVRASADATAWRYLAACDWPMGDTTPYEGVTCVPAATQIEACRARVSRRSLDVLPTVVGSREGGLDNFAIASTAAALRQSADSVRRLWGQPPVLSLSGGRDSRLVVASFLAARMPIRLRTDGAVSGEVDTARSLVERLGDRGLILDHQITTAGRATRPRGMLPVYSGAYARARQWHDVTEGLRSSVYTTHLPPRRLLDHRRVLISGVGGEFAHAPAYPHDIARLERLSPRRRADAFARCLFAAFILPRGLAPETVQEADREIRDLVARAAVGGVTDRKVFDWFYADERLRRWGLAGESFGRVMPLLVPEFLAAAAGMSLEDSTASALHVALIDQLVPEWTGVPFFKATLKQRTTPRRLRLWEEPDLQRLNEVFGDPSSWEGAFDVAEVQSVWARARAGRAGGRDELLLQRVLWRSAFTDHLGAVNDQGAPGASGIGHRQSASPTAPPVADRTTAPRPDFGRPLRALGVLANEIPLARKVARSALGRRLRRFLGS